jgi:hypothetical protein
VQRKRCGALPLTPGCATRRSQRPRLKPRKPSNIPSLGEQFTNGAIWVSGQKLHSFASRQILIPANQELRNVCVFEQTGPGCSGQTRIHGFTVRAVGLSVCCIGRGRFDEKTDEADVVARAGHSLMHGSGGLRYQARGCPWMWGARECKEVPTGA